MLESKKTGWQMSRYCSISRESRRLPDLRTKGSGRRPLTTLSAGPEDGASLLGLGFRARYLVHHRLMPRRDLFG